MAVKKRKEARKSKGIFIRATEAQKRELVKTARGLGLGLSSWMLSLALQAARNMRAERTARS